MRYFFLLLPASVVASCQPGFTGRNCQIPPPGEVCFQTSETIENLGNNAVVDNSIIPVCNGTNFPCFYKPGTQLSYQCLPEFGTCPENTDFDDTKRCAQGCTSENFVNDCCEVRKPCFYGDYVFRGDPYCVCNDAYGGLSCNETCVSACSQATHALDPACPVTCVEDGFYVESCCKELDQCIAVDCSEKEGKRFLYDRTSTGGYVQTRSLPHQTVFVEHVFQERISKHGYTQEEANSECCAYVEVCEDHMKDADGNNKCAFPLYNVCNGDCDSSDFQQTNTGNSACCETVTMRCDKMAAAGLGSCPKGFQLTNNDCRGSACTSVHFQTDVIVYGDQITPYPSRCCDVDTDYAFGACHSAPYSCGDRRVQKSGFSSRHYSYLRADSSAEKLEHFHSDCCDAIPDNHYCDSMTCNDGDIMPDVNKYCEGECSYSDCCLNPSQSCKYSGFTCDQNFNLQEDLMCNGDCTAGDFDTTYTVQLSYALQTHWSYGSNGGPLQKHHFKTSYCNGVLQPGVNSVEDCAAVCIGYGVGSGDPPNERFYIQIYELGEGSNSINGIQRKDGQPITIESERDAIGLGDCMCLPGSEKGHAASCSTKYCWYGPDEQLTPSTRAYFCGMNRPYTVERSGTIVESHCCKL